MSVRLTEVVAVAADGLAGAGRSSADGGNANGAAVEPNLASEAAQRGAKKGDEVRHAGGGRGLHGVACMCGNKL
jgi:hypothetical protein